MLRKFTEGNAELYQMEPVVPTRLGSMKTDMVGSANNSGCIFEMYSLNERYGQSELVVSFLKKFRKIEFIVTKSVF